VTDRAPRSTAPLPGFVRLFGSPGVLAQRGGGDVGRTRLALLIRLRWAAIAGQLAVVLPALSSGWLRGEDLALYLGVVASLAVFNLWSVWFLARKPRRRVDSALPHLIVDMLALTVLLVLSGGAWNPLAPVVFIHAGLGALVLDGWRSLALAGMLVAVAVAITLLPDLPPAAPDPPTPKAVILPAQVLVSLVVWAMTAWVAQGLNAQQRLLRNLQDHQGRVDRLRASGALAAGFSHEFSTPLNTLRMRLERLGRRDLDEAALADLGAAEAAADRCEGVLRSMVARQMDPNELRLEAVELGGLLRRITRSWSSEHKPVALDLPVVDHRCVMAPLPMTQVILDLLDNADEAMGGEGELEIGLRCSEDACIIEVRDRGPGWPDVVRKYLGQPFLTTKSGGTGLGLFNAWSLAMALGGTLRLEDRPGGGAIAALDLPCTTAEEHPA